MCAEAVSLAGLNDFLETCLADHPGEQENFLQLLLQLTSVKSI